MGREHRTCDIPRPATSRPWPPPTRGGAACFLAARAPSSRELSRGVAALTRRELVHEPSRARFGSRAVALGVQAVASAAVPALVRAFPLGSLARAVIGVLTLAARPSSGSDGAGASAEAAPRRLHGSGSTRRPPRRESWSDKAMFLNALECDDAAKSIIRRARAGAEPIGRADRAEPSRAEPSRPSRAEPSRAEPSRAEPSRAEPSRAEPSRAEPSRAEPSRGPVHVRRGASGLGCESSTWTGGTGPRLWTSPHRGGRPERGARVRVGYATCRRQRCRRPRRVLPTRRPAP